MSGGAFHIDIARSQINCADGTGFHVLLSISPVQTETGVAAGSAATGATHPRASEVPTWRRDSLSRLLVYAGDD